MKVICVINKIGNSEYGSVDPNELAMDKAESQAKNEEKYSEHFDGKNTLEMKQKFRNQYGIIFDQDVVDENEEMIDMTKLIKQSSKFYNNGLTSFNNILNEDKDTKQKFDLLRQQHEADSKNTKFLRYQQENNKKKYQEINTQVFKTYHNHYKAYATIVTGFDKKVADFYSKTRLINPKTGRSLKIREDLNFTVPEKEIESELSSAKPDADEKKKKEKVANKRDTKSEHSRIRSTIEIQKKLNLHFVHLTTMPRPSAREFTSITQANVDDIMRAFVYGGIASSIMDDIFYFDFKTQEWKELELQDNQNSDEIVRVDDSLARFGHTAINYKDNIIFFGGGKATNSAIQTREAISTVSCLNIKKRTITKLPSVTDTPRGRRNHTACLVNRNMIIIGGIDSKNEYQKDLWTYSFDYNRWHNFNLSKKNDIIPHGIAYHQAVSVVKAGKKYVGLGLDARLDDDYAQLIDDKEDLISDGIYLFGGKNFQDLVQPVLYILKLDKPKLEWDTQTTSGQTPTARFNHIMKCQPNISCLAICGGQNFEEESYLNDVHQLSLRKKCWVKVKNTGEGMTPRSSAVACYHGNRLLIFGGINADGYLSTELEIADFDPNNVAKYKNMDKNNVLQDQGSEFGGENDV